MSNKKILTSSEINKLIRHESFAGNRLPSFQTKRDLSLGGTKPKRTYIPNFNAARSKDTNNTVVVKKDPPTQKSSNNRGQKRPRSNKPGKYIETEGIFSEGIGKAFNFPRSYTSSVKTSTAKERQNIDALVIPKISPSDFLFKEEDIELKSSQYEANSDDNLFTDTFQALRVLKATTYEYDTNEKLLLKPKAEEPGDELCDPLGNMAGSLYEKGSSSEPVIHSVFNTSTETFSDENPAFSLVQFPDFLLGFSDGKGGSRIKLQDLPEGQIGKLIIRKSGKMEIIINNINYSMTQEMMSGYHQAMLFPGEQSMKKDNSLVTLGTIREKYTVTQDWEDLLKKVSNKTSSSQ